MLKLETVSGQETSTWLDLQGEHQADGRSKGQHFNLDKRHQQEWQQK